MMYSLQRSKYDRIRFDLKLNLYYSKRLAICIVDVIYLNYQRYISYLHVIQTISFLKSIESISNKSIITPSYKFWHQNSNTK